MDSKKQAEELIERAKGGPVKPVFDSATEWQLQGINRMFDLVFNPKDTKHNAGARIADDCFCAGCGARGFQFYCPRCA